MHALPAIREDLQLLPGPSGRDGQPTWTVHDPVLNRFFRIDWMSFEILSRWSLRVPEAIVESVRGACTLQPSTEDVRGVADFLVENELVRPEAGAAALAERRRRMRSGPLRQALHHYLFFRVPLIRPDRGLDRLLPWLAPLFSPWTLAASLAALMAGGFLVLRRLDEFKAALIGHLDVAGAVAFVVALIGVKVLHELGHALTAKRAGCRVPTMGVAFVVLWPMAYTDTSDSWRLVDRRRRLQIALAGIGVELLLGAWALLAWALLPAGDLRSACFVLATSSLGATLAVNASPFMRFDGYFTLSDWLDLPNLHARSFALARWRLREWLFGFGTPKPEHFSSRFETGLVVFAWATWIYRLVVFIGIALFVYHFFVKLVGIVLFVVEIAWFVALPIWREVSLWWTLARSRAVGARRGGRARRVGLAVLGLVALGLIPWPGRVRVQAILEPGPIIPLFTPGSGRISGPLAEDGAAVVAGHPLLRLESPEIELTAELARIEGDLARHQAERAALSTELRPGLSVLRQQAEGAAAVRQRWDTERARYRITAPAPGRAQVLDPDLRAGDWVPGNHRWGSFVGDGQAVVETFLDDDQVRRVTPGCEALFQIESAGHAPIRARVVRVDSDATRSLPDGRLAVIGGGHVPVRLAGRELVPERAAYRVTLEVAELPPALAGSVWRGRLVIRTEGHPPLARYFAQAVSVLVREWGW